MARDPAITFRGALKILGKDDPPWLTLLNNALGGVILASGVIPGASAVWNWVDQKNEATRLLREGFGRATERLADASGLRRHQLVIAAHTVLVMSSFFEAAREALGKSFTAAKMTDREKMIVATGAEAPPGASLIRVLYDVTIPAPSAARGFKDTAAAVYEWAALAAERVVDFLAGLNLKSSTDSRVAGRAVENYRSGYLKLMTAVPEFALWAGQIEHAATQSALGRLEQLLLLGPQPPARDLRAMVAAINRGELARPVLDVDTDGYGLGAVFPTVEQIFVSPHCRLYGEVHTDLDLLLAQHFTSAAATAWPMLLLGHPGAGKSLLMKVLAAKLPESRYTVVRVPLRSVEANAPVIEQIRLALSSSSNGRVSWSELADSSSDTIRVVLLDGLDELLQATNQDRHGYLHEVMEFQRVEALMDRPVAVIVTSRTLVADRVTIPNPCPVVEIEAFEKPQIEEWLTRWNQVNAGGPARPMRLDVALAQPEIARQPLLLLMLTLYYADPEVELRTDLSSSELYGRLLDAYARREVVKRAGHVVKQDRLKQGTRDQLRRLAITALGMFNRGRQSITEVQLSADLAALDEPTSGERVLGEFFFVHAPQAKSKILSGQSQITHRSYEFLHATFAEYLVAAHVVAEVMQVAATTAWDGPRPRPDDDLLFALLSHQPVSIQRPVLEFVRARFGAVSPRERKAALRTLDVLIAGYRSRSGSRHFTEYRPTARDQVRALASYSANLLLLRLAAGGPVKLADLWPDDHLAQWRSCVALWQAGMDESGYRSTLGAFWQEGGVLTEFREHLSSGYAYDLHRSLLRDDTHSAQSTALGESILTQRDMLPARSYLKLSDLQYMTMWLELLKSLPVAKWPDLTRLAEVDRHELDSWQFASTAWALLNNKPGPWPPGVAGTLARLALTMPVPRAPIVAAAAFRHKEVFDLILEQAVMWTDKAKQIHQFSMTKHRHPDARVGWVYVSKIQEVVEILLSDNRER